MTLDKTIVFELKKQLVIYLNIYEKTLHFLLIRLENPDFSRSRNKCEGRACYRSGQGIRGEPNKYSKKHNDNQKRYKSFTPDPKNRNSMNTNNIDDNSNKEVPSLSQDSEGPPNQSFLNKQPSDISTFSVFFIYQF